MAMSFSDASSDYGGGARIVMAKEPNGAVSNFVNNFARQL